MLIDYLLGYCCITELNVDVSCLVHAVSCGQDDVFIEDRSAAKSTVLPVQQQSLYRTIWSKLCNCKLDVSNQGSSHRQLFSNVTKYKRIFTYCFGKKENFFFLIRKR